MKRAGLLAAVLLTATLAACGGDDGSDGGGGAAGDAAGAVTIEHRYGTTTLESTPQRIVSLDTQWTDVLVAMDGPLAAIAEDPRLEGGRYPWQDAIPASVETIEVTDQIPVEAVAALQPDLIVITYLAPDQAAYDRLNQIAPTIGPLGDAEVDHWQDIARTAGEVLGTPDVADQLVADAERASADVLSELPGLEGKHYTMANYVPGDAIYVVADPDDGASLLFSQLGLSIDPEILEIADGATGRAELSLERVDLLDSDLLVLLTNGADPHEIPGYDALPAVESGAVAVLDLAEVTGLNTPTPLSVPYSLDAIRPALEAAAAGA
jgi:iron complex transport system substrate-binding protein